MSLFGAFGSAPSNGGTPSGGGGGGGSSITTETIVLTTYEITHIELRRNTKLIFSSKDQQYYLTIKKISTDEVGFVFPLDPSQFSLNIGESITVDLNSDEKLYVRLEKIKSRKADITLKKIVKQKLPLINITYPKKEEKLEEQSIITENKTKPTPEPEQKPKNKRLIGGLIVLIIVAIGLTSFFFFKKSKKNKIYLP